MSETCESCNGPVKRDSVLLRPEACPCEETLVVKSVDTKNRTVTLGQCRSKPKQDQSADSIWAGTVGPMRELDPDALFRGEVKFL